MIMIPFWNSDRDKDVVTIEIEHVNADALERIGKSRCKSSS
jgi:phosphoribosylaminoimidazole carboxylase (NCAIR synthetase)